MYLDPPKPPSILRRLVMGFVSLMILLGLLFCYAYLHEETFNKPEPGSDFGPKRS
jgi:energy-converting hydrogenase Eha subunit F